MITAGEQRGESPGKLRERETERRKDGLWLGLGLEAIFLKRDIGAPDSLQYLSGAHRTAHRKKELLRARGRCTGQCTVQCSVHTRLSGEPR
jgi:hypothetical protein